MHGWMNLHSLNPLHFRQSSSQSFDLPEAAQACEVTVGLSCAENHIVSFITSFTVRDCLAFFSNFLQTCRMSEIRWPDARRKMKKGKQTTRRIALGFSQASQVTIPLLNHNKRIKRSAPIETDES